MAATESHVSVAMPHHLRTVTSAERRPSSNLAMVIVGASALVISAVPLEPTEWILRMNPSVHLPHESAASNSRGVAIPVGSPYTDETSRKICLVEVALIEDAELPHLSWLVEWLKHRWSPAAPCRNPTLAPNAREDHRHFSVCSLALGDSPAVGADLSLVGVTHPAWTRRVIDHNEGSPHRVPTHDRSQEVATHGNSGPHAIKQLILA